MKFNGADGNWGCVFTTNKARAVRNKDGLICTLYTPTKYAGQDERYDKELEENRCNQRLIAAAPLMADALIKLLGCYSYGEQLTPYDVKIAKKALKAAGIEI